MFPEYPRVPLWLTLAFSAYVALWYLHVSYRLAWFAAFRFELVVSAVLALAAVARGLTLRSPLTPFVLLLLVCIVIQVPMSVDVALSWDIFVDRVLKYVAMGVLIASLVQGPSELRWFLGAFLVAMLKLGQEGFFGVMTGSLIWENQGLMRLHGPTPMYEHPNSFSGMAVGTVPFVLYLWPVASRWQKVVLLTLGLFAMNIVLFTGSRTGYVAVCGLLLFAVLRSGHKLRAAALALVVIVGAVAFTPSDYQERFESIFTQKDKEGASTQFRIQILRDAWEVFRAYPLGVGVGAFPAVRRQMFGRAQDAHNLPLEVATNLGIQGLIAFVAFVGAMLVTLGRVVKRCDAQLGRLRSMGADLSPRWKSHLADVRLVRQSARAIEAFLMARLVLGLFGMDLYEIYWWFALGLCVALYHIESVARLRTDSLLQSVPSPSSEGRPPQSQPGWAARPASGPPPTRVLAGKPL